MTLFRPYSGKCYSYLPNRNLQEQARISEKIGTESKEVLSGEVKQKWEWKTVSKSQDFHLKVYFNSSLLL